MVGFLNRNMNRLEEDQKSLTKRNNPKNEFIIKRFLFKKLVIIIIYLLDNFSTLDSFLRLIGPPFPQKNQFNSV